MPIHEHSLIRPENIKAHDKLVIDGVDVSGHWSTFIQSRVVTDYNEKLEEEIAALPGGEHIHRCWQCGSCTNSCTVNAVNPDFNPRYWIYLIRIGMESELLRDKDIIWQCVSCNKCTYACPRDVVPEGVMKATAHWLELKGHTPKSKSTLFDEEFSEQVFEHRQDRGRPHHPALLPADRTAADAGLAGRDGQAAAAASALEDARDPGARALVRPRTRGWAGARAAIGEYVEEQEAKQHRALGLAELIEQAERDAGPATAGEGALLMTTANRTASTRRSPTTPAVRSKEPAHAYNRSTQAVGKALGLELDEVKNWNCCGAMEVKNIDPKLQTYLSSRVMSIAANEMGAKVVMAPCNGCYHNLKKAEYDLAHDDDSREVVERLSRKAGHETYQAGQVETIHALDWIKHGIGEDELKRRLNSLKGLKVANYYGCMYTRPRHIFPEKDQGPGSESTSQPHFMDDLLAAAGAENVDFPLKTACCGGAHTLSDSDISTKLVLNILRAAEAAGADVIATECPTCHSGLEMHQVRAEKVFGQKTTVKMLYFTQLLGLALGLSPRKVGVHENVSESLAFLREKGIA